MVKTLASKTRILEVQDLPYKPEPGVEKPGVRKPVTRIVTRYATILVTRWITRWVTRIEPATIVYSTILHGGGRRGEPHGYNVRQAGRKKRIRRIRVR